MATVTVIDARPATVDLYVYAGDDLKLTIDVTDNAGAAADLTGYTAKAQIRATADDATSVDFTATVAASAVNLTLPSASVVPAKAVWDCEIVSGTGEVTTLCGGKVTTTPGVSR